MDEKCKAQVERFRKYKNHILGSIFIEAADTIEELMKEKTARETPATWIVEYESENGSDPYGLFSRRYRCSKCGDWQTYGKTKYCPNCGKPMVEEAKDCHNCKHRTRDMGRECQSCLDAGDFPLWE